MPLEGITYQQRDIRDNDTVCIRVPGGELRLGLHPTPGNIRHCVVRVERHVCVF